MLCLVLEIARFLGSAMGIAIANRKNRCDFGALRTKKQKRKKRKEERKEQQRERERERERKRERDRERKSEKGRPKKAKEKQRETLKNKQKCPFSRGGTGFLLLEAKEGQRKNKKTKNKEGLGPSEVGKKKNKKSEKTTKTYPKNELFSYQSVLSFWQGSKISLFWQLGQKARTQKMQ